MNKITTAFVFGIISPILIYSSSLFASNGSVPQDTIGILQFETIGSFENADTLPGLLHDIAAVELTSYPSIKVIERNQLPQILRGIATSLENIDTAMIKDLQQATLPDYFLIGALTRQGQNKITLSTRLVRTIDQETGVFSNQIVAAYLAEGTDEDILQLMRNALSEMLTKLKRADSQNIDVVKIKVSEVPDLSAQSNKTNSDNSAGLYAGGSLVLQNGSEVTNYSRSGIYLELGLLSPCIYLNSLKCRGTLGFRPDGLVLISFMIGPSDQPWSVGLTSIQGVDKLKNTRIDCKYEIPLYQQFNLVLSTQILSGTRSERLLFVAAEI